MLVGGLGSHGLAKRALAGSESEASGSARRLLCLLCLFLEVISGCVSAAGPEVRRRQKKSLLRAQEVGHPPIKYLFLILA